MNIQNIEISDSMVEQFCKVNGVSKLSVFGSVLREDFSEESDIDFLVKFSPETRVSFMTLGRMKRELQNIFNREIDLVPEEGLKPIIKNEVLSQAKVIYAA